MFKEIVYHCEVKNFPTCFYERKKLSRVFYFIYSLTNLNFKKVNSLSYKYSINISSYLLKSINTHFFIIIRF